MQGASVLSVEPNPVVEGQDITIHYDGSGSVSVAVDFGVDQPVPMNPSTLTGKFTAPVGARTIIVVVDGDPDAAVIVEVTSAGSQQSPKP